MLRPAALTALLLCVAPVHVMAAPKPSAAAALKRLATVYSQFPAFSISTIEEDFTAFPNASAPLTARSHFSARLSRDGRLALRANEGGRLGVSLAQLYDGQSVYLSTAGRPEKRVPVAAYDQTELKPKVFCQLSGGIRMIGELLQDGHLGEPYNGPMTAVSHPNGSVVLTSQGRQIAVGDKKPFAVTTRLTLRPDGTLAQAEHEERRGSVLWWKRSVEFSRPQPLTLARPFAWETFRFPPNPKFTITPEARAVLERSAAFYGPLKTLDLGFQTTIDKVVDGVPSHQRHSGEVAFDRRGRMRFQSTFSDSMSVYDGKHRMYRIGDQTQVPPDREKLNTVQVLWMLSVAEADFPSWVGLAAPLADLLGSTAPVIGDSAPDDQSWTAVLAPAATVDGVDCDVVFVKRKLASYWTGANRELEYWFARDNGRLVRVVTRVRREDGKFNSADTRILSQTFNEALPESLWNLNKPVAAK